MAKLHASQRAKQRPRRSRVAQFEMRSGELTRRAMLRALEQQSSQVAMVHVSQSVKLSTYRAGHDTCITKH